MTATDPRTAFIYPLFDVTRLMRTHFDRRAEPLGLTRAQWRALKFIQLHEAITQRSLAELLEMEPIPVGRVLDRLQQAGFVERRADPADRRCWRLYLTDKARAVTTAMEVISAGLRDDTLRGIDDTELALFVRVIERMKQNLLGLDKPATDVCAGAGDVAAAAAAVTSGG